MTHSVYQPPFLSSNCSLHVRNTTSGLEIRNANMVTGLMNITQRRVWCAYCYTSTWVHRICPHMKTCRDRTHHQRYRTGQTGGQWLAELRPCVGPNRDRPGTERKGRDTGATKTEHRCCPMTFHIVPASADAVQLNHGPCGITAQVPKKTMDGGSL